MKFLVNESACPLYEQEQMEFLHRTPSADDKGKQKLRRLLSLLVFSCSFRTFLVNRNS